jgi:hypothetical protein
MLSLIASYGPENPRIEAVAENRIRLSWMGEALPKAVDGMCITYCNGGMMFIGRMQTPVRYCHIVENTHGQQVMELQISAAALATLRQPQLFENIFIANAPAFA